MTFAGSMETSPGPFLYTLYTLYTPLRRGVPAAFQPHELAEIVQLDPTQSLSFHHGRLGTVDAVGTRHALSPTQGAHPVFSAFLANKEVSESNGMAHTPRLHCTEASTIINGREVKSCHG